MLLKQENRLLTLATELGPDVLAVRSALITERLSQPFQIETELSSADDTVDFDAVVGRNATLSLALRDGSTRYFNGFVSRFTQEAGESGLAHYRATIVPWLWFLTRTAGCRIFQEQSVPDIIEAVFKGHGFSDYKRKLSGTYAPREYCVQYRETDFNFVSRLMEQEGIYYFFEHENGRHRLVLADSLSAHEPCPAYEKLYFHGGAFGRNGHGLETVTKWAVEREVQPVAYALSNFDYQKPQVPLVACASVTRSHGAAHFEVYDSPGEFLSYDEGTRLADRRLEELQAQFEVLRGCSDARGLAPGHTFELQGHPRTDQNRAYLVTGTSLRVTQGEYASVGRNGNGNGHGHGGESVTCEFTAIMAEQTFRAPRVTPRPFVQGPQTAIVVAGPGEDILTDELGRVKVQFHWDRERKLDASSSCWIRVSQNAAGKGWGLVTTPRKGQEVIVDFIEGDPDRPIITGRVYNAEMKPPYPLPENKSILALKSNSTGPGHGFNELRFEDRKGEEQLFLHAEKNHDVRVKNDSFATIGHDQHLVVGHDERRHVKNDRNDVVDRDLKEKIGRDHHQKIVGKEAREVGQSLSLVVKGDVIEKFNANHSEVVAGDCFLKAKNIILEATTNITIKVGNSYIAIDAGGIKISAVAVELDAKSALLAKAGVTATFESKGPAEVSGAITTVKATGVTTVKGAAVMLG